MTTAVAAAIAALLGAAFGVGVALAVVGRRREARGAATAVRQPGPLRRRLAGAGLAAVSPAVFVGASALAAVVAGAVALGATGVSAFAVAVAAAGAAAPWQVLGARVRRMRAATAVVWPDVADQLVSSIRAGLALPDAVAALAETGPPPTRAAFAVFAERYRRTGNAGLALDAVKDRLADPAADRLVETLRLARAVGGAELTAVLRALAHWLRQDHAARAEAAARRSWIVIAARLGLAAPWIVLAMLATRPEAVAAYNTPAGAVVVIGCLTASIVAYRIMLRVGRLPQPRRWFG